MIVKWNTIFNVIDFNEKTLGWHWFTFIDIGHYKYWRHRQHPMAFLRIFFSSTQDSSHLTSFGANIPSLLSPQLSIWFFTKHRKFVFCFVLNPYIYNIAQKHKPFVSKPWSFETLSRQKLIRRSTSQLNRRDVTNKWQEQSFKVLTCIRKSKTRSLNEFIYRNNSSFLLPMSLRSIKC